MMSTARSLLGTVCFLYTANAFALVPAMSNSRRIVHHAIDERTRRTQLSSSTPSSWSSSDAEKKKKKDDDLMNRYNFNSLESIAAEWTAVVKAGSSLQPAGIFMEPRDTKTNFADFVTVKFPRGAGLGLELLELAGGREDGRGITVVEAIVPGGPADGVGLLPGDTLVDITIESTTAKSSSSSTSKAAESKVSVNAVELECLSFDATVAALRTLPPPRGGADDTTSETMIVTVKRLRRRPKVTVNLQYPSDDNDDTEETTTLELFCGENLRRALLVRGVKLNDPLARRFDSGGSGDCGADGTCATCAVAVVQGADLLTAPTTMERQLFRDRLNWRMSCKAKIGMREGTLTIKVNPRQW
jgi:ferredoxin